ncbi:RNB domain-containing ribonuclease [Faecalicatena sp. AGMB00832]|uniref:Ribonuclease R n=1 Tax=Faecalicatena faecalis TaxID=2726362 RepID=A0ABS6D0S9_9FIRM|nr:RNB domain-containing ribonuclease [Faecalicatena faecalis]MBU3875197.1 RNB domain-containing ribonuclease [Faecalicatena faecalis]
MDQTFEKRKKVIYDFICDDFYVPMKIKEIAVVLQIAKEQRGELKEVLDALEAEGKIYASKKGKYSKGQAKRLTGTFQANARGFGFVILEGDEEDVFISEENMNGAFQGDQVEFVITKAPEGKRKEGKIVRILSHGTTKVVGLYEKCKSFGFVRPDNQRFLKDIYIPEGKEKGAMTGHKVVVELLSYGGADLKPEGKVVEIIGHVNDPGTDIMSIVKGYDLPVDFPERVMNQAERVGKEVTEADMAGRMDLRDWQMVTIDGEDAKDLDDAVSLTKEAENYMLGVHIADVTNYVQEKSALDREALKRGTSVYLADRVIPMLPHKLSNGICSLNAGEDRLALSCIMTISPKGEVIDHVIAETVIKVDERMSYTSVAKILNEQKTCKEQTMDSKDIEPSAKLDADISADTLSSESEKYKELVPMFLRMAELSSILREKRRKRGSIDFDFPETKMVLDENGKPVDIKPYERNTATKIIEDFMLMANETVAEEYFWRELPFLYRTHEQPDEEKIKKLSTFINNFGYHIHVGNSEVKPKEVQKLLGKVEGTPQEALISRLALRSMKQAKYTPENTGHFGLAAKYYTHFTSPIRRYPDLQIHRIIKENLRGRMNEDRIEHYEKILPQVAIQASETERRAEEAERETIKLKKVEYMQARIGQTFEGVISGLTKWGAYVELENTIEGLVHVMNMTDDHYDYWEEQYELVGEHTRKVYKLGQRVRVRVLDVDRLQRTIDFEFCAEEEEQE